MFNSSAINYAFPNISDTLNNDETGILSLVGFFQIDCIDV